MEQLPLPLEPLCEICQKPLTRSEEIDAICNECLTEELKAELVATE